MKITGTAPRVVALWGVFNAILVGTLIGFGERTLVLATAASMVGLVFIIAGLIRLTVRRRAASQRRAGRVTWRQPPNGDSAVLFALSAIVLALTIPFYVYAGLFAIIPFIFGVLTEISARRAGS